MQAAVKLLEDGQAVYMSRGRFTKGVKVVRIEGQFCVLPYAQNIQYTEHRTAKGAYTTAFRAVHGHGQPPCGGRLW